MQFPINLLLAGIVVVLAWILNLSAICAMRSLSSSTRIVYGFLSSLCVANLFLATIDFPPSIISNVLVSKPLQHILCVSWTYLDTLLCNVTILHLLGSSLDCYLRLRHQARYLASTKQILTYLKLSAPWTLSFIQSTAFMAIAQITESTLEDGVCLISDPNFLILRSVMCFGVPISCSAILVFLSAKGLSYGEPPPSCEKAAADPEGECLYESFQLLPPALLSGITRDETQETIVRPPASEDLDATTTPRSYDCNSVLNYYQHQCPRHGLLALPISKTMPLYQLASPPLGSHSHESLCKCCPSKAPSQDFGQLRYMCPSAGGPHCPDLIPTQQVAPSPNDSASSPPVGSLDPGLSLMQHSLSSGNITEQPTQCRPLPYSQSLDIQRIYARLPFQTPVKPSVHLNASLLMEQRRLQKSQERMTVAINLSLCIFTIVLWGPFIIGSLIQGVCKPPYCILPVSNARINEFKWLSYVLCVVYPLLFIAIDTDIRAVIRSSVSS